MHEKNTNLEITDRVLKIMNNHLLDQKKQANSALYLEIQKMIGPLSIKSTATDFLITKKTQSQTIKLGDALEAVIKYFLELHNPKMLSLIFDYSDTNFQWKYKYKKYDYDLHFVVGETLYIGEIKLRDNHDSTKKEGQEKDLLNKFHFSINNFDYFKQEHKITLKNIKHCHLIIFFLDDSFKKNGEKILSNLVPEVDDFDKNPNYNSINFKASLIYGSESESVLPNFNWKEMVDYINCYWENFNKSQGDYYFEKYISNIEENFIELLEIYCSFQNPNKNNFKAVIKNYSDTDSWIKFSQKIITFFSLKKLEVSKNINKYFKKNNNIFSKDDLDKLLTIMFYEGGEDVEK